ncbi:MAG: CAP domain-containing protein [Akkermansiaceae bacterium]
MMGVSQAEAVSLEPLTSNSDIWKSNKYKISKKFPNLSWEQGEESGSFVHQSKGLTFWGQPVHHVDLQQNKGKIVSVKLTVLDQGTALFTKKSDFDAEAARWNKLITEKLRSDGVKVPVMMNGKVKHLRKAWRLDTTVVVLSANIGVKPDRIEVIFYERDFGLEQLKLSGQQLVDESAEDESEKVADVDVGSEEFVDDGFAPKEVKKEIRDTIKEIEAREAPNGVTAEVQDAVNLLNVYRFLSRVPYDVKADKKMIEMAADAASICSEKGELSHGFGHSTDKCNLAMNGGRMTMAGSVTQYMNDAGANNRERRGHRRWCINHRMGKTGFGIKGSYSAMYSMDHSDRGGRKNYSYPGHGFYPVKYLHGNGWSYHIVEGSAPSDCLVQVWKLKKFDEKAPSWNDEPDGRELKVAFKYIYSDTIVFEPDSEPITRKGTYLVRLKGSGLKEQYLVHLY